MKANLGLIGVAFVTVVGAAWFWQGQRTEAIALAKTMDASIARQAEVRRANAAAAERLAGIVSRCRELETILQSTRPPPSPKTSSPAAVQAVSPKMAAAIEAFAKTPFREIALEKNPELQARYLASRRAEWTGKYGAFWAQLGLTGAQIDRFVGNLTEAAAREMDLNATRRAQGLEESDPAIAKFREDAAERAAAAQRELLGDAGFQQLQEYEIALPMRDVVDGLATTLVFLGAPLSAEQSAKLTRVLVEANTGYQRSGRPENLFPQDILSQRPARETVDSARVLEEIRAFLTPEQMAPLELNMVRMREVFQMVNMLHESSPSPVIGFTWGRGP